MLSVNQLPSADVEVGGFAATKKSNFRLAPLTICGRYFNIMLGDPQTLPATIPFAPSVYQGTGEENRLGIVFEVDQPVVESVKAFEEKVRERLAIPVSQWRPCYKDEGEHRAQLRAKITKSGQFAARLYDTKGEGIEWPQAWRFAKANAVLSCRGVYNTGGNSGLLLEVQSLSFEPPASPDSLPSPFQVFRNLPSNV